MADKNTSQDKLFPFFQQGKEAAIYNYPCDHCKLRKPDRRNAWIRGWQEGQQEKNQEKLSEVEKKRGKSAVFKMRKALA